MKKSLMMLGAVAMVLASCTNEEVLNVSDSRTIGFDAFVGNVTKGDVKDTDFAKFWVFGTYGNTTNAFYTNIAVEDKSGVWTPEKVAYWKANTDHYFAAYADGTNQLATGVAFDATTGTNGTLKFTDYAVGENDLVADVATKDNWDGNAEPSKVDFTFKHLLSKVKFTFTTGAADDYVMKIENLKIVAKEGTSPIVKASCDFTGSIDGLTWTASQQDGTGEYTYATLEDCAGGTNNTEKYVIPQNNALTVSFDITFTDKAGTEIASKDGVTGDLTISNETAWKAGNVYNYQVKINPDDVNDQLKTIEFDNISVDDWENATNQPDEIQEVIPSN